MVEGQREAAAVTPAWVPDPNRPSNVRLERLRKARVRSTSIRFVDDGGADAAAAPDAVSAAWKATRRTRSGSTVSPCAWRRVQDARL